MPELGRDGVLHQRSFRAAQAQPRREGSSGLMLAVTVAVSSG